MTLAELFQALKSTGYPVSYGFFEVPQKPPYLIYQLAYSDDFKADNQNYVDVSNFQVELYTEEKDLLAEGKVQGKLKELKLPYSKIETFIESEKLYQIIYEVQLIGG